MSSCGLVFLSGPVGIWQKLDCIGLWGGIVMVPDVRDLEIEPGEEFRQRKRKMDD